MKAKEILFFCTLLLCACTTKRSFVSQPDQLPPTASSQEIPTQSQIPSPIASLPPTLIPSPKATTSSAPFKKVQLPSSFHSDEKRSLASVDTIVVHSLYNPHATDPFSISSIQKVLAESEVSSHFVITRDGITYQLVSEEYQAWHAGESTMPAPDGRSKVNLFSIGIELVGNETSGFTNDQYISLVSLMNDLARRLPIRTIVGHSDIAPGRKTDPWKFDWSRVKSAFNQNEKKITFLAHDS